MPSVHTLMNTEQEMLVQTADVDGKRGSSEQEKSQ